MSDKIPWEVGKEYKTLGGERARIYATDGVGNNHIHGAYFREDVNRWSAVQWNNEGKMGYFHGCVFDLLPPAKPRIKGECWLVVEDDRGDCASFYYRREALRYAATYHNKAIIHVTYDVEEGEGLA